MRTVIVALGLWAAGCASESTRGLNVEDVPARRETARAEELSWRAADLLESEHEEAERQLRQALSADLFFGPAHDNLARSTKRSPSPGASRG